MSITNETKLHKIAHELASQLQGSYPPAHGETNACLDRLVNLGTQLWLDTGDLELARSLWHREFTALTTNNTLANQVVQTGSLDETIRAAARRFRDVEPNMTPQELVMEIGFVVNSHLALRLAKTFGTKVSVELHPSVAEDIEQTVSFAERYYSVCPEQFIIKIPLTPEGYCSVARVRAKNIPVNYTLGFSARQNVLAALVSRPSYVNVFLGRLNSVVIENGLGDGKHVGEKAALATQRAILEIRKTNKEVETHVIAASMRDANQVIDLAGMDIYTMPPKVVSDFLKLGVSPESLQSKVSQDYPVSIKPEGAAQEIGFHCLWEVEDRFWDYAQNLAKSDRLALTGEDIRREAKERGIDLFYPYTKSEREDIRQKGKIPELVRWKGRASLDSLMTESALQSFTSDQRQLDDRILKFLS